MILFLDFDGVCHPVGKRTGDETTFANLPLLEDWLRTNTHVNVVISSSWREMMDLEVLQHIFSEDLHSRIIDKCPIALSEPEPEFWRHAEIMAWINLNQYAGNWLALDDTSYEFPPEFAQLVLCDREIGIDESIIKELTTRITSCLKD